MPKKILVASPHPAFGELIRLSLEEGGTYRVRLVQTTEQFLQCANEGGYDLAIVDCDITTAQVASFLQGLFNQHPDLQRIIIPPDNDPNHPALKGVSAAAYLSKPFYLPDLLDTLEQIFPIEVGQPAEYTQEASPEYTWLHDPKVAAKALEQALPETSVKAAVLLLSRSYLAGAGTLPEAALNEIAQITGRSWQDGPGDTARYVRLSSNGSDVLLFARAVSNNLLLALACEPSMPLTRLRSQAVALIKTLTVPLPPPPPDVLPTPESEQELDEPAVMMDEEGEAEGHDFNLDELLAFMPSPDPEPGQKTTMADWMPEDLDNPALAAPGEDMLLPWEISQITPNGGKDKAVPPNLADTVRSVHLAETRPNNDAILVDESQLQPLAAAFLRPAYTCILIPLRPEHLLAGALAEFLKQNIPSLCEAFGWTLESVLVQTNYLQWTVRLQPGVSPSYLVRLIRKQTSSSIFKNFPQFQAQDIDDFWAPGFLIVSGTNAPETRLLNDFIIQTRRRQGFPLA